MRVLNRIGAVALAGTLAVISATTAQAAPITATGAVALIGVTANPVGSISLGTTFTFAYTLFSDGTGALSIVPTGSALTTQSITATIGMPVQFTADWGSFQGTVTSATYQGPASNRVVKTTAMGIFTPLAGPPDLTTFDPGPMNLTFSATQTGGPHGSVSASYTIASVAVPEPLVLSLLGVGMGATAIARYRRRS